MARYQQAQPGAVAVLGERLNPQLYRFFARQLGNGADAEDMVHDAWLHIHRVRHTYRAGDPLLPCMYPTARRVPPPGEGI
jgi:RNA polymerase sigma-70 factor (ECF subfamily)